MIDSLSSLPSAAITALAAIVAAVTTAAVTLAGVWLSNRASAHRLALELANERQAKRQDVLRERIEELYVLASAWTTAVLTHGLPYLRVMQGELTYNQALDMTISDGQRNAVDFKRLEMLVMIYFPELKEAYSSVLRGRDEAAKILSTHKQLYKRGDADGRHFVQPFLSAQTAFENASESLKAAIASLARSI